jgi:cellulose synthase/poly-beta-1,6-N-acetylglucosamine synthase-like glycosyltransferase
MMKLSCEADCEHECSFDIETRSARFRSMPKKQLTVVIPAYNEENRLPPTIRKALEWADKTSVFEIELIIVDDGSCA